MNISVPSRYACLEIEGDDQRTATKLKESKKKKGEKASISNTASKLKDLSIKSDTTKLVGVKKTKTASLSAKARKNQHTQQWEEWKEKDSELVNGHYEEDLQNAILLSKLEYEENAQQQTNTAQDDKDKLGKKKKSKAMSLDQFLNTNTKETPPPAITRRKQCAPPNECDNFFESVTSDAREMASKDIAIEQWKKREENIDEIITIANLQAKLELERSKNVLLENKLEKATNEIASVRKRNKTLCGILGSGEMKDKADVLLEVERLHLVKNELINEIARLTAELEQERSKSTEGSTSHKEKQKEPKSKKRNNK